MNHQNSPEEAYVKGPASIWEVSPIGLDRKQLMRQAQPCFVPRLSVEEILIDCF